MTGLLSRIFGGGKKKTAGDTPVNELLQNTIQGLLDKANFDLSFELVEKTDDRGEQQITVEFSGADEEILKDNEGQMIDAIQLFLKRVVQHNFPEDRTNIAIDCNGYQEESSQALVELAEKLKGVALEKGKSVYFRALPPKDRKVIHQYLAGDDRVKSRSVGEGLFKKIKIYPVKNQGRQDNHSDNQSAD